MRITITEAEIKTAITNHIEAQGFNLSGKQVDIDLKATRGDAGYTADIDITDAGAPAAAAPAKLDVEAKVVAAKAAPTPQVEEPANDTAEETPPFATEEAAEADAEEAAPEPSTRKSLFGDQKRPVNG